MAPIADIVYSKSSNTVFAKSIVLTWASRCIDPLEMPLEKWTFAHGQNVGSRYAILKGHFVLFLEYMTEI